MYLSFRGKAVAIPTFPALNVSGHHYVPFVVVFLAKVFLGPLMGIREDVLRRKVVQFRAVRPAAYITRGTVRGVVHKQGNLI